MDPVENPFAPGAGAPPPQLAGRESILHKAEIALKRLQLGRSEKSFLLVGLRGVGKTILLNKMDGIVQASGNRSIFIEAHENKDFINILVPHLRRILFDFDRDDAASRKVKKAFRVFKSFLASVKVRYGDFEFSLDIDPEKGVADSGDLEVDLPLLLEAIGEAAQDRKTAVSLVIDELQYLSEIELSALIMAIHRMSQKQLPVLMIGAGLPQLTGLVGRSKSYAERLFDFPQIGPLEKEDAFLALQEPVRALDAKFDEDATEEIFSQTRGYPYFLQEWGYQSWNLATSRTITLDIVQEATQESLKRLDEGFFRVRFDRLTPKEKEYLQTLASFGGGNHRSGDIADKLGVKTQSVAPVRNNLIKKGMIYSPAHGDTEFTVPLFDEFMKRVMPR